MKHQTLTLLSAIILCFACQNDKRASEKILALNDDTATMSYETKELPEAFKKYWYSGEAEITAFELEQERYGEIRKGKAVLVYVTEDFLPEKQVKADGYSKSNIPILKLNATKKFNTGIYPYSIMQSTFYPVSNEQHAVKISSSVQEWCGHVYTQLNNREQFEITSHSYFENEADAQFSIKKTFTENEIWTQLRIDPQSLPTGKIKIIQALEHLQLRHKDIKAYSAVATLRKGIYEVKYTESKRALKIKFNPQFPYDVIGWEETNEVGYGLNKKVLTTKATKLKTLKTAYWNKNSNKDQTLRDSLKLN